MKLFTRLRELLEKATPAPWTAFETGAWGDGFGIHSGEADTKSFKVLASIHHGQNIFNEVRGENYLLIAEAHNQLPKVLEALDVAVEALESISGRMNIKIDWWQVEAEEALAKIKELSK